MRHSPCIRILTPNLVPYDAITNDVTRMHEALIRHGYTVRVFAEGIHPSYAPIAKPISSATAELWRSSDDILIYHHSMGWPAGEDILFSTASKTLLRYHNITPPQFFTPYSREHQDACTAGREATKRIAGLRCLMVLGDSRFNCEEMVSMGIPAEHCRVMPPMHSIEELARGHFDMATTQKYTGETANILFVGGIKPNKGHARAIRAFAMYHHEFNDRSRLIFAGGIDERLHGYVRELQQLAVDLGVGDCTVFAGSVNSSELKSLYVAADAFLCASEHEGFCVPLVEAMYFRVPIVAAGGTAIGETVADSGFVIDHWDEFELASCIAELLNDPGLATRFGDLGRARYKLMFSPEVLETKLSDIITGLLFETRPDGYQAADL